MSTRFTDPGATSVILQIGRTAAFVLRGGLRGPARGAKTELRGELVRGLHDQAGERGGLRARHAKRRTGDAHRRHHTSSMIADGCADAAEPLLDLFVVDRVTALAKAAELASEQRRRRDR